MSSGPRWLATIGEPASSARRLAALSRLARLRPQRLQVGGEDRVGAEQRLDAHRRRDVGGAQQEVEVVGGQQQHAEHAVGAVDQREALLLGQLHGRDAGRGQRLGRRARRTGRVAHVALAHQRQRAVGQRGEVAGAAEGAVLAHDRRDAGVEQRGVGLGDDRPHAGAAGGQGATAASSIRPRTTSRSTSAPVPAACERISERCSWARCSGGMCLVASAPKPVEMP